MSYIDYGYSKYFYYSIPELSINRKDITINIYICKSVNDLKDKIATELQIPNNKLSFKQLPKEELKYINNYFDFQLSINISNPDINIQLPNGERTQIKNCYKKNFDGIIKFLENERFYYTQDCINRNFHLYLSGKEIRNEKYPFLDANFYSLIEIKLSGSVITLNYLKYQFNMTSLDYVSTGEDLVKKAFPSNEVSIVNTNENSYYSRFLNSTDKYIIRVETKVKFKDFKCNATYWTEIKVDLFDTILKVRELLYRELTVYGSYFSQDHLFILDTIFNPIFDLNKKLADVQSFDRTFYYKIDKDLKIKPESSIESKPIIISKPIEFKPKDSYDPIEKKIEPIGTKLDTDEEKVPFDSILITIVCDDQKKFDPIKKIFKLKAKIKEVQEYILTEHKIKDRVIVKYKKDGTLVGALPSYTLEELEYKIREKLNDKMANVLYFEIKSKEKEDSDSDDETVSKPTPKVDYVDLYKKKSDEIKKLNEKAKKLNDDEDDKTKYKKTNEYDEPSGIKKVQRPRRSASSCKPKTKALDETSPISAKNDSSNSSLFKFRFDDKNRSIKFSNDSSLSDCIDTIKTRYNIDPSEQVEFHFIDNSGDKNPIRNYNTKMKEFVNRRIYLNKKSVEEGSDSEDDDKDIYKKQPIKRFGKKISPKLNDIEKDSDDDIEKIEIKVKPVIKRAKIIKKSSNIDPIRNKKVNSDDSDEDEGVSKKKPVKKNSIKSKEKAESESESDDDSEKNKKKSNKIKPKKVLESEDSDEDEGVTKKKLTKKNSIKSKGKVESESESDDDSERAKKKPLKTKTRKYLESDDDDDDEDEKVSKKKLTKKKQLKSKDDDESDDSDKQTKKKTLKTEARRKSESEEDEDDDRSTAKKSAAKKSKSKITKYYYQICDEDEIEEVELNSDATVRTLKEAIAEKHKISNISVIKIIFASKELLDKILLEPLEIGNMTIFVYIPPVEEILLLTAKANVVHEDEDDDEDDDDDY